MKSTIVFLIFIGTLLCLSQDKKQVVVEQIESDLPIIIQYDSVKNYIFRIQFPLVYRIHNMSCDNKKIDHTAYYYEVEKYALSHEYGWNSNVWIERREQGKLVSPYIRGRIMIDNMTTKDFVFNSGHSIPSTDTLQSLFRPYIPIFKESHKDTLHIGTIQMFKEKFPGAIDLLLKNDSIQFLIYTPWTDDEGMYFALPVEKK